MIGKSLDSEIFDDLYVVSMLAEVLEMSEAASAEKLGWQDISVDSDSI